ncbi:ATP-binding protein [Planctomycetales bacterium ZRK34]|nr:ATP-binding protein [Planctomycetales bacterium ZRK34]
MAQTVAHCVGERKFEMWLNTASFEQRARTLHITVATRFAADWIHNHFNAELHQAAEKLIGESADVRIHVDAEAAPQTAAEPAPAPAAPKRAPDPGPASRLRYRLEDFIIGSCNELAYAAACRLVDEPDAPLNPLFIHGACGLGKTHLIQGLCRRFVDRHPNARWRYTSAEAFTNQYIAAVQAGKLNEFRRKLRGLDLLVVDDVHFLSNKSKTQTEFLHTFDAIDLHGAKLVLASDAHPKLIKQFSEALVSRFMSGMVVRIEAPDIDTRRKLIIALARRRNLMLLDSAVDQLADHPIDSVRELEGLITRLAALASLNPSHASGPIGAALVNQLIEPGRPGVGANRPVPLKRIVDVVCEELSVEPKQVFDRCRHRRVVLARSIVIHLARQLTTLSYPELARGLSRPNHSSIITAHQRIGKQINDRRELPPDPAVPLPRIDQLVDHLRRAVVSI